MGLHPAEDAVGRWALRKILFVAGESSGDLHGASLIKALLQQAPDLHLTAMGGPRMAEAGAELFLDITGYAAVGLFETLLNAKHVYQAYRRVRRALEEQEPDALVLIDFPDFNLRLVKRARQLGIRTVYYISPQLWAWREGRVRLIRDFVDKMIVIFDFEVEFYRKHGVEATFVGHPLLDVMDTSRSRGEARAALGLDDSALVLGLLPGSRGREFDTLFPIMAKAAHTIHRARPDVRFLVGCAPRISPEQVQPWSERFGIEFRPVVDGTYDVMRASDLLLVASGTATVEAMILQAPMIVTYKVAFLTWLTLRWFMRISTFAMVNIVAGRPLAPEFMQWQAKATDIARTALEFIDQGRLPALREAVSAARQRLGGAGASERAAQEILELLAS